MKQVKLKVESKVFCSYFYYATKEALRSLHQEKDSHRKYYFAITSVILGQSVLESYVNSLIYDYAVETSKIGEEKLIECSIKKKWLELPMTIVGETFDTGSKEFKRFVELVDLRNKLIHFKPKNMDVQLEFASASEKPTIGEILNVVGHPQVEKIVFHDVLPIANRAVSVVDNMIAGLHSLLKSPPPKFLQEEAALNVRVLSIR